MRTWISIILFCLVSQVHSQPFYNSGRLPLHNYSPSDYGIPQPQNFDIIQDEKGLIYIANNGGVLLFDGVKWQRLNGEHKKALHFAKDSEDHFYVGGENEIGHIVRDSIGVLNYVFFTSKLPDSLRNFGRIDAIYALENELCFIGGKKMFLFDK